MKPFFVCYNHKFLQSRTRGRKENGNVVVVKRVRGRTRASTTTTEQPERSETTRRSAAIRTRAPYTRTSATRESTRDRVSDSSNEETRVS